MDLNKDIKDINFNIDISTITILYNRYKNFLLPTGIIIFSIFLFLLVVSPQIQSVLSQKEEQKTEEAKLAQLKQNYSLLQSMDQTALDSDYSLLTQVLPSTKDFAGIINSISSNAASSGVSIGDFQFSIGDITSTAESFSGFPSIEINLNVIGNTSSVIEFVQNLYKSSPLAQVTSIQANAGSAQLVVDFYYKSFPQNTISDETVLVPLSSSDKELISTLSSWQINSTLTPLLLNTSQNGQASGSSSLLENATASGSASPF